MSKRAELGVVLADFVAEKIGSWPFVLWQSVALAAWLVLNTSAMFDFIQWDKYPFILLNLMLSFQAAYCAPVLLIAQKRKERIDEKHMHQLLRNTHDTLNRVRALEASLAK